MNNQSEMNKFLILWRNFIKSPRSHFVYETFCYLIFLITFSYFMLSEFEFAIKNNNFNNNTMENNKTNNQTHVVSEKLIKNPSWVEFLLIYWVFALLFHEIDQVKLLKYSQFIYHNYLLKF